MGVPEHLQFLAQRAAARRPRDRRHQLQHQQADQHRHQRHREEARAPAVPFAQPGGDGQAEHGADHQATEHQRRRAAELVAFDQFGAGGQRHAEEGRGGDRGDQSRRDHHRIARRQGADDLADHEQRDQAEQGVLARHPEQGGGQQRAADGHRTGVEGDQVADRGEGHAEFGGQRRHQPGDHVFAGGQGEDRGTEHVDNQRHVSSSRAVQTTMKRATATCPCRGRAMNARRRLMPPTNRSPGRRLRAAPSRSGRTGSKRCAPRSARTRRAGRGGRRVNTSASRSRRCR